MQGYNRLAGHIGTYKELAIFRRFLILNARNLLCLEAEIVNLEADLRLTTQEDRESGDPVRSRFECSIAALKEAYKQPGKALQWERTLEMRGLLNHYNQALLQFRALLQLPSLNKRNFKVFDQLIDEPIASGTPFLTDFEYDTWSEEYMYDMTSVGEDEANLDAFTRLINRLVTTVYHRLRGARAHDPISVVEAWGGRGKPSHMVYYSEKSITAAVNVVVTILAAALPTLSACGVYFVRDPLIRMLTIVACTTVFAIVLSIFSRPRRVEVFGATCAYAAVLIVFVGSSNGSID